MQDVDVTIPVPKGTRGRDLLVELKKKHIKVALKGQPAIIEVYFVYYVTKGKSMKLNDFSLFGRVSYVRRSKSTTVLGPSVKNTKSFQVLCKNMCIYMA